MYIPWKDFLVPKPNIKLLLSYTDFYRMEFAFYAQVVKETQQSAQDCKEKKKLTLVRFTPTTIYPGKITYIKKAVHKNGQSFISFYRKTL
jgi:hypothetical protein